MCHCPACQGPVAVTTLQHADQPPAGVVVGEVSRVAGKAVVERCWNFTAVTGHGLVFMFACIEATAVTAGQTLTRRREVFLPDENEYIITLAARLMNEASCPVEQFAVPLLVEDFPELILR